MVTLQIAFLFGQCDLVILEMKPKLLQDLKQLEIYLDFFMRDMVLLLDILENPYYWYNVRSFVSGEQKKRLVQSALVAVVQLNGEMTREYLEEAVRKLVHVERIPEAWVGEVLEARKGKYAVRAEWGEKWPVWCLQRDIASATLLLEKAEGDFLFECVEGEEEYLQEIRRRVYLNRNFQSLLEECLLRNPYARMVFFPWICKFVYYGMEVVAWGRGREGVNADCYDALCSLMSSRCVAEFREEVRENKKVARCRVAQLLCF